MASASSSRLAQVLAGAALLVAAGHLAYALGNRPSTTASPAASPQPEDSECRCDDAALRSEIAELRHSLRALEAAAGSTARPGALPWATPTAAPDAARRATPRPPRAPTPEELAMAEPGDRPLPALTTFVDIPAGVDLEQKPDGTLDARSSDPEIVGTDLVVVAFTESGETKLIKVRVR